MNKELFYTPNNKVKEATAVNEAGGKAYNKTTEQALATYAFTSTLGNTYYSSAKDQLDQLKNLLEKTDPEFVAKLASYTKKEGLMRDMPAVLIAYLICNNWHGNQAQFSRNKFKLIHLFNSVIDNVAMLRKFVTVMRSGAFGRKSLGSFAKKLIQRKINNIPIEQLFRQDIGNNPSLSDILKLAHPNPYAVNDGKTREAFYAYLTGNKIKDENDLPDCVKEYEGFKLALREGRYCELPNLPFEKLAALELTDRHWSALISQLGPKATIKNLNTAARHNCFGNREVINSICSKLTSFEKIAAAKIFPYQLFSAYKYAENIPPEIQNALLRATELATNNIPELSGTVAIGVDVSGSMSGSITDTGIASKMRIVDVAALFSICLANKNKNRAHIIPFDYSVHSTNSLKDKDMLAASKKLAEFGGGGTNCSLVISHLISNRIHVDTIIIISDDQSWIQGNAKGTPLAQKYAEYKKVNPGVKLILLDLTPTSTTQAEVATDTLLIAGFSDQIFSIIPEFIQNSSTDFWVKKIQDHTY